MVDLHLKEADKCCLLTIARVSIRETLAGESLPDFDLSSTALENMCGAFVTIEKDSQLRGCIGTIEANQPLHRTVSEMAIAAAFRDPRFPPLREDEFDRMKIEISVLSPLERITGPEELVVGKHGLLIRKGLYSGLLLPQVAVRYAWSKEKFLCQSCLKAGLNEKAWEDSDCELWVFSADIFREVDYVHDQRKTPDN